MSNTFVNDRSVNGELRQLVRGTRTAPSWLQPSLVARQPGMPRPNIQEGPEGLVTAPRGSVEEAIIRLWGRPSMLVQKGRIAAPDSPTWVSRLAIFRALVEPTLPSVGRINLRGHASLDWVGTAWMVASDVVITNRHVAREFAYKREDGTYAFRVDETADLEMEATINFTQEYGTTTHSTARVTEVLYIAPDGDNTADIAILRVTAIGAAKLPDPITLAASDIEADAYVGVTGFPARDSRNDAGAQGQIFGNAYGVKRFAPGMVLDVPGDRPWITHDASTLGGNSGSVVVDLATGHAVGLHFGGQYLKTNFAVKVSEIRKVLAALNITPTSATAPEEPASAAADLNEAPKSDPTDPPNSFEGRAGFDPDFLGVRVTWPEFDPRWSGDLVAVTSADGGSTTVIPYAHFSVSQSKSRRMPVVTGVNIDGARSVRLGRTDRWAFDGRVPRKFQIGNAEAYSNNAFDRGHMVRREDPVWGDEAEQANVDTFHYTNACPQHEMLNQRTWLELENMLLDTARQSGLKATVFTGPVLRTDDWKYREIRVPAEFFKVVAVVADNGELEATAYLQSQEELIPSVEEGVFHGASTWQVTVQSIEERTGLDFGSLRDHDPLARQPLPGPEEGVQPVLARRIRAASDILHRA